MLWPMKSRFLLAIAIPALMGLPAVSAPLRTTTTDLSAPKRAPVVYPDLSGKTWWLFAGLDLGGISYSSINLPTEGPRSGVQFGGRLLVSRYAQEFVFEGGLGWKWISASGVNPNNTKDTISSKLPYLDLSVRYRVGKSFQIGPEFEFWLGTDNGLNDFITSSATNNGKFLGINGVYEWDRFRKHRLGGRLMFGLGVPGRTVTQYVAYYQMSFDVFGETIETAPVNRSLEQVSPADLEKADSLTPREPIPMAPSSSTGTPSGGQDLGYTEPEADVMSTPAPPVADPLVEPEVKKPVEVGAAPAKDAGPPVFAKKLVLSLGANDLPFGSKDAKLPLAHQARIKNIGKFLGKNKNAWKSLQISGLSESSVARGAGQKLALKRAQTVQKLLIQGGAPASKIKAKPEKGASKNRRVELEFRDVKDAALIKRALDQ